MQRKGVWDRCNAAEFGQSTRVAVRPMDCGLQEAADVLAGGTAYVAPALAGHVGGDRVSAEIPVDVDEDKRRIARPVDERVGDRSRDVGDIAGRELRRLRRDREVAA